MEDKVVDSGGRICKYAKRSIMFIVPMLMLVWITSNGYKLATTTSDTGKNSSNDNYIAMTFGVVTVVFGLVYFIIGLSIVAELGLDFRAWLQQGDKDTSKHEEKEQETICEIFIRTVAIMVSMIMLAWAIHYGYNLAAESRKVVIYSHLVFLIGVISMAFGFIYFIIGIGIVAESALDLSGRLQQGFRESETLLDKNTDGSLEV